MQRFCVQAGRLHLSRWRLTARVLRSASAPCRTATTGPVQVAARTDCPVDISGRCSSWTSVQWADVDLTRGAAAGGSTPPMAETSRPTSSCGTLGKKDAISEFWKKTQRRRAFRLSWACLSISKYDRECYDEWETARRLVERCERNLCMTTTGKHYPATRTEPTEWKRYCVWHRQFRLGPLFLCYTEDMVRAGPERCSISTGDIVFMIVTVCEATNLVPAHQQRSMRNGPHQVPGRPTPTAERQPHGLGRPTLARPVMDLALLSRGARNAVTPDGMLTDRRRYSYSYHCCTLS